MHKNRSFGESFKYALSGFFHALKNERNLRFHIWITALISIFAYNFGLARTEWIALIMAINFVLVCELINTAIENAVDTATKEYSPTAKIAKDVAAGAVFTASVSAVIVGLILFFDIPRIFDTIKIICSDMFLLITVLLIMVIGGVFVVFGGKRKDKEK